MTTRRPAKPRAPRDRVELVLGDLVDVGGDAHHQVRRLDQVLEAFGDERGNLGERLARDQRGRKLAGDGDRHARTASVSSRASMPASARVELVEPVRHQRKRGGGARAASPCALRFAGGEALRSACDLGVDAPALGLDQRDGRLLAAGEVLVEDEFGGR